MGELNKAIKYKIHSYNSVTGVSKSTNNNVFYDTYEEAFDKVGSYLRKDAGHVGYIIMKTYSVIIPEAQPLAHYVLVNEKLVLTGRIST